MPGMRPTLGAAHGMHPTQPKVKIYNFKLNVIIFEVVLSITFIALHSKYISSNYCDYKYFFLNSKLKFVSFDQVMTLDL